MRKQGSHQPLDVIYKIVGCGSKGSGSGQITQAEIVFFRTIAEMVICTISAGQGNYNLLGVKEGIKENQPEPWRCTCSNSKMLY